MQAARSHGGSDNITAVVVDVVVGDADDDGDAGGAAVTPDFRTASRRPLPMDAMPLAETEAAARNRTSRLPAVASGARPSGARDASPVAAASITLRTLLFVLILAALVVGALAAVRWYNNNSYFVAVDHNELVIYQGRVGGFLWYHPVQVQRTGVTTADVPSVYLNQLDAGVEESSVPSAQAYISNLVTTREEQLNPATTPSTAVTTTTTTRHSSEGHAMSRCPDHTGVAPDRWPWWPGEASGPAIAPPIEHSWSGIDRQSTPSPGNERRRA